MNIVVAGDVHGAIGALGGNYSPRYFKIKPAELPTGKLKHYTESHIAKLVEGAPFDILLVHEAPTGFVRRDAVDLGRPEIRELIEKTQPRFALFGHHHWHTEGTIGRTEVIGLPRATRPEGFHVLHR